MATRKLEQQQLQPLITVQMNVTSGEQVIIEEHNVSKEMEDEEGEWKELLQELQSFVKDPTVANQLCLEVMTSIAMMMSFGMLFPPLILVIVISLFTHIIIHRMILGLWIDLIEITSANNSSSSNKSNNDSLHSLIAQTFQQTLLIFDHQWQGFETTCQNGLIAIFFLTSWIWAFALFDTLGDAVGAMQAYWIVLVMCLFPVFLLVLMVGMNRWKEEQKRMKSIAGNNKEGEITNVQETTEMVTMGERTVPASMNNTPVDVENPLQLPHVIN